MIPKLPDKYINTMKELLGDEFEDYIQSFENERLLGLRVNTSKVSSDDLSLLESLNLSPIPWCKEGYYYSKDLQPAKHPYYYAGLYYIQEPSAMAPASILPIEPGDKVLDLCAAPGGKSTHLGDKLKGSGLLVSNDISFSRAKALLKNIELSGITNGVITSEEPERLVNVFEGYFDKILVDAPCSGEGMFRKDPSIIKNWEEYGVEYYSDIQKEILPQAARMLKPGGMLLYSTCTFSPLENEQTIKVFLESHEDFEILPFDKSTGFSDGRPDWVGGPEELKNTARLWPHKINGEGHYLALLKKADDGLVSSNYDNNHRVSNKELESFYKFCKESLNIEISGSFKIVGTNLYLLPEDLPNLKGLRVLKEGLLLGELKKDRFEPHQAFAMGLKMENVKNTLNMELSDQRVIRYLKGETIECQGDNGWILICVDDKPLGWGKVQNGRIKNKYAKGWRML